MEEFEQNNLQRLLELIDNTVFSKEDSLAHGEIVNDITKKFFSQLAETLYKYNQQKYDTLEKKILIQENSTIPPISILLMEDNDHPSPDFFPMCPSLQDKFDVNGTLCHIFINEDYEKMRNLLGDFSDNKVFTGHYTHEGTTKEFLYSLEFDDSYLKCQDLLNKFCDIYQTPYRIMYSPFATKFFKIISKDTLPRSIQRDKLNFNFSENNLHVIEKAKLCWNLEIIKDNRLETIVNRIEPYGKEKKYIYTFPKKRGNIEFCVPTDNQIIVYDYTINEQGLEISLNKDTGSFNKIIFHYIDTDSTRVKDAQEKNYFFTNDFTTPLTPVRICSWSDIEYAIRPFRLYRNFKCEVIRPNTDEITEEKYFLRYAKKFCKDRKAPLRTKGDVYLQFSYDKPEGTRLKFESDYVNYVLSYLRYYYPELDWIGVRL